jgi:hypothetical protein
LNAPYMTQELQKLSTYFPYNLVTRYLAFI